MRHTTSSGSGGGAVLLVRSQPDCGEVSQSRTYCLSKEGWPPARPGSHPARRPEPRRVRGQHLIGEQDRGTRFAGDPAELELRVGQDQATLPGHLLGAPVHRQGEAPQPIGIAMSDRGHHGVEVHVLVVVAELGLGRGGEDRFRQPGSVDQTGGQRHAAHSPGRAVLDQPGPGQVPAGHALDGEHLQRPAQHGATGHGLGYLGGQHVVADQVSDLVEPPQAQLREDGALVRDRAGQNPVVGRDPIGGHEEQRTGGVAVQVTHLAGVDVGVARQFGGGRDVGRVRTARAARARPGHRIDPGT